MKVRIDCVGGVINDKMIIFVYQGILI